MLAPSRAGAALTAYVGNALLGWSEKGGLGVVVIPSHDL